MYYSYPGKKFPAISVTGNKCEALCIHCKGNYLQSMIQAETPDNLIRVCNHLNEMGVYGCLISGGCDSEGRVPLPLEALHQVRDETDLILNVHTGLVDESMAEGLEKVNPHYISFDVPTPYALQYVLSFNASQKLYFKSLSYLEELPVFPHVMVGLEKKGERETMKMLQEMGFSSLVVIVFTPTRGTPLEKRTLNIGEVGKTFEIARSLFPNLILGCMRPRIKLLEEMVTLFDNVVAPTPWAKTQVDRAQIPVHIKETCCVVE
ncbi:MAG: hypothetical protein HXS44_02010 [Theionarchaea archaeon]|nr:hypothetical protein [Theionarchaea archaeon]